jgi:hypothetical protein
VKGGKEVEGSKGSGCFTELLSLDSGFRATSQLEDCQDVVRKPESIEARSKGEKNSKGAKSAKGATLADAASVGGYGRWQRPQRVEGCEASKGVERSSACRRES